MAGGIVVHRFGPFELDPASGRLFRGPRRVPLSDTQAAILVQLVSNVGEVVSREALIEAAWGNTAVTENSLRQAIRRLRQALGDGRNGAIYIETLRTRGFRFAAAVQRGERDAARVLLEVRRLDLIIDNELAGDKVIEAVWKQVRRVDDPRRPRTTGAPEPPAPATGVDAAAPQPA